MERKLKNEDADLPVYWFLTIAQQLFRLKYTYRAFLYRLFLLEQLNILPIEPRYYDITVNHQRIINGIFP